MAKSNRIPAPPFVKGDRVLVGDLQFCVEFSGSTGAVAEADWKAGTGWVLVIALDEPVTVHSGNVHRKLTVAATEVSRLGVN